ncbi:hypothetical protein QQ045_024317 [Rhodiola kirilowii]
MAAVSDFGSEQNIMTPLSAIAPARFLIHYSKMHIHSTRSAVLETIYEDENMLAKCNNHQLGSCVTEAVAAARPQSFLMV